jgi:hypothetical protein
MDLSKSRSRTSGSLEPFNQHSFVTELPIIHNRRTPKMQAQVRRNLSSSRTNASTQNHIPHLPTHHTEILAKAPSSESDISYLTAHSQPARGYFRSNRPKLVPTDRNSKTAALADYSC